MCRVCGAFVDGNACGVADNASAAAGSKFGVVDSACAAVGSESEVADNGFSVVDNAFWVAGSKSNHCNGLNAAVGNSLRYYSADFGCHCRQSLRPQCRQQRRQ